MIYKISLFILVALCATIGNINAQDGCVPWMVDNVYMESNGTLTWQVLPDEPCDITDFIVYISEAYAEDDLESRVMETSSPYLDVSFLTHCRLWNFSVVALSYDQRSNYRTVFIRVPLTSVEDLEVRIVSIAETEGGLLVLWQPINPECADRFRVDYKEVGRLNRRGVWSFEDYVILDDVPFCSVYEFWITAFHGSAAQIEGPEAHSIHNLPPGRMSPPRLVSIIRGATYFNTTWLLDEHDRNPCPLRSLEIDGAPNFQLSIPLGHSDVRPPIFVRIQNLRADTMYVFRASVINQAGESGQFPVAAQTTSMSPDVEE